jgi:hypothetical protein
MRIATLIISLIVSLAMGVQSCAVYAAGSIGADLSEGSEKANMEDTSGAGAVGMFAALLWIIGAGFVLAKPKVSTWLFSIAAVFCVLGGAAGEFSDLYIYAVASVLFALASWRGIAEKDKQDEQNRAAYQADIAAAAQMIAAPTSVAPPEQA